MARIKVGDAVICFRDPERRGEVRAKVGVHCLVKYEGKGVDSGIQYDATRDLVHADSNIVHQLIELTKKESQYLDRELQVRAEIETLVRKEQKKKRTK